MILSLFTLRGSSATDWNLWKGTPACLGQGVHSSQRRVAGLGGAASISGALGLPNTGGCEFGTCGGGGLSSQQGATTAPISWCAEHPTVCTLGADAAAFARAVPAVAASVLLLNMQGDNKADPNRCVAVRQRAIAACTDIHIGTGGRRDNSGAFFACVRKKMEAEGCQY